MTKRIHLQQQMQHYEPYIPPEEISKKALQEYVQTHAGITDEVEINRLIIRQIEDQIRMGKQLNRQAAREIFKYIVGSIVINITKVIPATISKHIVKQIEEQIARQIGKQIGKQIQLQIAKQIPRQITKQIPRIIPTTIPKPFVPQPAYAFRMPKIEAPHRRPYTPPPIVAPIPLFAPEKKKKDYKRRVSPFGTRYKEREFIIPTFIGALQRRRR